MAIKLIAFDLDGTVFPSPFVQEVSPRVAAAFERAHAQGIALAVCSGRPERMLGGSLCTAPWLSWAISTSGARVIPYGGAASADAPELHRPMRRETGLALLSAVEESGGGSMIHAQSATLADWQLIRQLQRDVNSGSPRTSENEDRGNYGLGFFGALEAVDSVAKVFSEDESLSVEKVDVSVPSVAVGDELQRAMELIGGLNIARTRPDAFEVTGAGATKGEGLAWLCETLGIQEEEAVSFGDSANDLSLAGRASTFVAMGNAAAEVKVAADSVCASVTDDGVALWLEERLALSS